MNRLQIFLYRILYKVLDRLGIESNVYYIGTGETLPQPLTAEEERALLDKLNTPEETAEVRSALIERNLRLVVYIARKFENTGIQVEDLMDGRLLG